jgi:hypothetical protein
MYRWVPFFGQRSPNFKIVQWQSGLEWKQERIGGKSKVEKKSEGVGVTNKSAVFESGILNKFCCVKAATKVLYLAQPL